MSDASANVRATKPTDDPPVERVEPALGDSPGHRARIGLIALSSGFTAEQEMHAMLPPGTLVLTTRVRNSNTIDLASLAAMEGDMRRAASTLLPDGHLDAVVYSCTSGTIAMGERTVFDRIREVRPGVAVTTPFSGAVAALTRLGVERVAMLTPYSETLTKAMRAEICRRGIKVVRTVAMGLDLDSQMSRVRPETVREIAIRSDTADAQAIFISCTALETSSIIEDVEQALGKPVVTSNQALAWHSLRLSGYDEPVDGFGTLFRLALEPVSAGS